jgi:hypothetical protein
LGAEAAFTPDWRRRTGTTNYDNALYWNAVGALIIREAIAQGGFWTELFDPDKIAEHWQHAPDRLAIVHLLPQVLEGQFLS